MAHSGVVYIAVDFDGTIVDHQYPAMGEPNPGAIDWMKTWAQAGAKIILHTMRDDDELMAALEYLDENEVPIYSANGNPEQFGWTESTKTWAQVYVDDCGVGTPMHKPKGFKSDAVDWNKVGPMVYARILGVDNIIQ